MSRAPRKFDIRRVRSIEIVVDAHDHMPTNMTAIDLDGERYDAASMAHTTIDADGEGKCSVLTANFGDPRMKVAVMVSKEVTG